MMFKVLSFTANTNSMCLFILFCCVLFVFLSWLRVHFAANSCCTELWMKTQTNCLQELETELKLYSFFMWFPAVLCAYWVRYGRHSWEMNLQSLLVDWELWLTDFAWLINFDLYAFIDYWLEWLEWTTHNLTTERPTGDRTYISYQLACW